MQDFQKHSLKRYLFMNSGHCKITPTCNVTVTNNHELLLIIATFFMEKPFKVKMKILLSHGAGGEMMNRLISDTILKNLSVKNLGEVGLSDLDDGALFNWR